MPNEHEQPNIPASGSEVLNPVFIAQMASRLFNELPEAGSVPKFETDVAGAPSSLAATLNDKKAFGDEQGGWYGANHLPTQELPRDQTLPFFSEELPAQPEHDLYFLPVVPEKKQKPLGHHANNLTEQQNYSQESDGSYGLDQFIRRTLPAKPESAEAFSEANPASVTPFFTTLNGGLPKEDDFSFNLLYRAAQNPAEASATHPATSQQPIAPEAFSGYHREEHIPELPGNTGGPQQGQCYAEQLYRTFEQQQGSPDLTEIFQSLRGDSPSATGVPFSGLGEHSFGSLPELPGKAPAPVPPASTPVTPSDSLLPFSRPELH